MSSENLNRLDFQYITCIFIFYTGKFEIWTSVRNKIKIISNYSAGEITTNKVLVHLFLYSNNLGILIKVMYQ